MSSLVDQEARCLPRTQPEALDGPPKPCTAMILGSKGRSWKLLAAGLTNSQPKGPR